MLENILDYVVGTLLAVLLLSSVTGFYLWLLAEGMNG